MFHFEDLLFPKQYCIDAINEILYNLIIENYSVYNIFNPDLGAQKFCHYLTY